MSDVGYDIDPEYEARLHAWAEGWDAARGYYQPQIDLLKWTTDRLYTEMCRRTPPKEPDRVPFAKLEQIRDDMYAGRK